MPDFDTPQRSLFAPIDIASLVYFRVVFGAVMLWEVWRYYSHGWIERYFIDPAFHFTYLGFDWVQPWPGDGMHYHFYALGVLAFYILVGFLYRLSAALFFLGFTYVFLLEQARYLNHFYFVSLVSLLMIFIPAHRKLSADAYLRPAIRSETAPAWCLWVLRAQMGFVYFFGGVAKLDPDWLQGWPLRMWLPPERDFPVIGPLFDEPSVAVLFSYGGLLLDLLAVPLLLWRRTRIYAVAALVVFHVMNARLFTIGIFPWFSIAMTLLFFPPDWPRRILNRLGWGKAAVEQTTGNLPPPWSRKLTVAALAIFLGIQIALPLRHWLYPGDVDWTEEGHRFSWHMKLRDKEARAQFFLSDQSTNQTWEANPDDYLTSWQHSKMSTRPYMILQFAHHLAEQARNDGHPRVKVRALVAASLNGRESQLLIDPTVDLAAQPRTFLRRSPWITPLEKPLPDE